MSKQHRNTDNPPVGILEIISNIEVSKNGKAQWLNDALSAAISEATAATDQYGKESVVTVAFSVTKIESGKLAVGAKLTEKMARGVTTPVPVYMNVKGELFLDNPVQPKLYGFDESDDLSN